MPEIAYSLGGVAPSIVLRPTSISEAQQFVSQNTGHAIIPWGGGTWRHLGHTPAKYDIAISTLGLAGLRDYSPSDLSITILAGTTWSEAQNFAKSHGQYLPVDVAAPDQQTVGGVVASRANGLSRVKDGSIRDALLGIKVINSAGELIAGGGKVVKNVAGYDLCKLYCGSFGSLGLIVEATFKVNPIPSHSKTLVFNLPNDSNAEAVLDSIYGAGHAPSFIYLLNARACRGLLPAFSNASSTQTLVIGFDGTEPDVDWQVKQLGSAAAIISGTDAIVLRNSLRDAPVYPSTMTVRFHIASSQVGAFSRMIEWTAKRAGFYSAVISDTGTGYMWAHFEPINSVANWKIFHDDLRDKASRCGGSFILCRLPTGLASLGLDVWSPVLGDVTLMKRIKEHMDPLNMWSPGRGYARI